MEQILQYLSEITSAIIGFIFGYGLKFVRGSKDVESENQVTQDSNRVIGGTQAGRDVNIDN